MMTVFARPRFDRTLMLCAAGLVMAVSACGSSPTAPDPLTKALDAALAATQQYQDVNRALADGFAPAGPCVAAPGQGAMGIHYVNFARMTVAPDVTQPQALLYVPEGTGVRLVGVEYIQAVIQDGRPYTGQAPPTGAQPAPRLFERAFDGPSAPRSPGAPWQYELHVWIWKDNPSGRFAPFNPTLSCS